MNVNFYVRSGKVAKSSGTAPLELSITLSGKRVFIATQYRVTPAEWKKKRKSAALTEYMDMMRARVNEILTEMLRAGEPVTPAALTEYIKSGGYKSYSVDDLFNEYLAILEKRVGNNLTKGVFRKYELVRNLFFEDIDKNGEVERVLTKASVLKFKAKVESKYEQATAAGYLRKLKSFVYYALDNNRLNVNPFQGVKIRRGEKPIVYLKEWEQRVLINGKIENESLSRVRDYAVLQMSTGMAYADLEDFKKSDVKEKNGVFYIEKPRHKTGKVFTAVIMKPGLDVLGKYDELPKISNQKYNAYLKTIQDLLGISTTLTTHVFRKTYATTLINAGIRIETVAAAMGHDSKTCAKYYAKLKEDTILEEIAAKVG